MGKRHLPGLNDTNKTVAKPPEDVRFACIDEVFKRQQQRRTTEHELSLTLRGLRDKANKEKQAVFGAKKWKEYKTFREERREREAELQDSFTASVEGQRRKEEFKAQQVAASRSLIKELGVDVDKLKNVQERYKAKAREAVAKAHKTDADISFVSARPTDLPKFTDNPWTFKNTPYDGGSGYRYASVSTSDGYAQADHYENRLTGEITCRVYNSVWDADDFDSTNTIACSSLYVWFKMPAPGMVEAWIGLQSIENWHSGYLADEWGWSDASLRLTSRLYLGVLYPRDHPELDDYSSQLLVDYRRGESEGSWTYTTALQGSYLYGHLYSLQAFPTGQWVLLDMGIRDEDWCWVNDMSFRAQMANRWLIQWVALRSTGAP